MELGLIMTDADCNVLQQLGAVQVFALTDHPMACTPLWCRRLLRRKRGVMALQFKAALGYGGQSGPTTIDKL